MERFEVIIIGAGIAGCGLAYNLKKIGYSGKILVIDKNGIGGGKEKYRNTFKEVVEEYHLPFEEKFKGLKFGIYDRVCFTLDNEFYFINYCEACKKLLRESGATFYQQKAINFGRNKLVCSEGQFCFKYLIDCSGSDFFAKKKLNQELPFRYWIGRIRIIDNSEKKITFDLDYYYHFFTNENFLEDVYVLGDKIVQGDWAYVDDMDLKKIIPHKKRYYDTYLSEMKVLDESEVILPSSPVFPIVTRNIAFLGDSFGCATPNSSEGIRPILKSSKILAESIIKDDLKSYERDWKRIFFKDYYQALIGRMDLYSNSKINKFLKAYPPYEEFLDEFGRHKDVVLKRLRNEKYVMPTQIKKKFPLSSLLIRQAICRAYLKLKYAKMQLVG